MAPNRLLPLLSPIGVHLNQGIQTIPPGLQFTLAPHSMQFTMERLPQLVVSP